MMSTKLVTFPFENLKLSGAIHFPTNIKDQEKTPAIILVHGFVGSKVGEHRLFVKAARYFSVQGYTVFRFDFSGCGESEGDYSSVMVTQQIKELQSAIDYVSSYEIVDENEITVIGHSLGGAVSSLTAAVDSRIKKLILWSPVARPFKDITRITGLKAVQNALQNGKYDYQGFYLSHTFFQDLKQHNPLTDIESFKGDTLVIHASQDKDVPKENGHDYYTALRKRNTKQKSNILFIENADHTFSSYGYEIQLFELTYEWLVNIKHVAWNAQ